MITFKIFGINLSISIAFMGVYTLMLYIDKTGLMLPTLLATIIHEAGHFAALLVFKSKPQRIILRVGAIGISGRFLLSPLKEITMLIMGPFFNIVLFFCFYWVYNLFGFITFLNMSLVMLVVGVFNLLPIIGLDGGDILKIILSGRFKMQTVNIILFSISLIAIFSILLFGFFVLTDTKSNISLILMGIYLILSILLSKKQKNYCKIHRNIVK